MNILYYFIFIETIVSITDGRWSQKRMVFIVEIIRIIHSKDIKYVLIIIYDNLRINLIFIQ